MDACELPWLHNWNKKNNKPYLLNRKYSSQCGSSPAKRFSVDKGPRLQYNLSWQATYALVKWTRSMGTLRRQAEPRGRGKEKKTAPPLPSETDSGHHRADSISLSPHPFCSSSPQQPISLPSAAEHCSFIVCEMCEGTGPSMFQQFTGSAINPLFNSVVVPATGRSVTLRTQARSKLQCPWNDNNTVSRVRLVVLWPSCVTIIMPPQDKKKRFSRKRFFRNLSKGLPTHTFSPFLCMRSPEQLHPYFNQHLLELITHSGLTLRNQLQKGKLISYTFVIAAQKTPFSTVYKLVAAQTTGPGLQTLLLCQS